MPTTIADSFNRFNGFDSPSRTSSISSNQTQSSTDSHSTDEQRPAYGSARYKGTATKALLLPPYDAVALEQIRQAGIELEPRFFRDVELVDVDEESTEESLSVSESDYEPDSDFDSEFTYDEPIPVDYSVNNKTKSYQDYALTPQKSIKLPKGNQTPFPILLHHVLDTAASKGHGDLIHWSDNGRAIVIPDKKAFEKKVLPHFGKGIKYDSFVRQLALYNFKRVQKAPNRNKGAIYYSPEFLKGRYDLASNMGREKIKNTKVRQKADGMTLTQLQRLSKVPASSQTFPQIFKSAIESESKILSQTRLLQKRDQAPVNQETNPPHKKPKTESAPLPKPLGLQLPQTFVRQTSLIVAQSPSPQSPIVFESSGSENHFHFHGPVTVVNVNVAPDDGQEGPNLDKESVDLWDVFSDPTLFPGVEVNPPSVAQSQDASELDFNFDFSHDDLFKQVSSS